MTERQSLLPRSPSNLKSSPLYYGATEAPLVDDPGVVQPLISSSDIKSSINYTDTSLASTQRALSIRKRKWLMASAAPATTNFQKQTLPAWRPLLTPKWVIVSFFVIGALFMIFGIVLLEAAAGMVELRVRYDNNDGWLPGTQEVNVTIDVKRNMHAPIYVYYELDNFHQNVRRYVKSRSNPQLYGDTDAGRSIDACKPMDAVGNKTLYPCGLIASSWFNDTISAFGCQGGSCRAFNWTKQGINWESDSHLFVKRDLLPYETRVTANGVTLPEVNDPDFINWMRPAGFNRFRKLYRIIHEPVTAGQQLVFQVNNEFPVSYFGGSKSIVVSTQSWIGAKNSFLGFAYLIVSIFCLAFAIGFLAYDKFCGRKLGMRKRAVATRDNSAGYALL